VAMLDRWGDVGAPAERDGTRHPGRIEPGTVEVAGLADRLRTGNHRLGSLVDGLAVELRQGHSGSQAWGDDADDSTSSSQFRS
jgi:hypothetical protein